jgi:hypothetical protein
MKIDEKLNLVIELEREGGSIWVHSTPIGRETFKRYYLVLAKAFSKIYKEGLDVTSGPRVAAMVVEDVARELGVWDGEGGVEGGLMAEIRRLSNVVVPAARGWATIPLESAINEKRFSEEEAAEVENAVCFFIVASAMHSRKDRKVALLGMTSLWTGQITSSNSTEFAASLRTSTETAPSPPPGAGAGEQIPG